MGRKNHFLLVDLLTDIRDVAGVVGNTLEIGDGMEVLGHLLRLLRRQGTACQLHKIGAKLVLITVDQLLGLIHLLIAALTVLQTQMHGAQQIITRLFRHGISNKTALLNSQRRMLQEALLQPIHIMLLQQLTAAAVRYQPDNQLFQQRYGGHQHQNRGKAKQGIHQRHSDRGHDRIHENKVHNGIGRIEYQRPDRRAQHIDKQINESGAAAADIGTQCRKQHGHGRADGNAHDDGQSDLECDGAGAGQHLQNTHGGAGALQHAGE